ncbi:MAG: hypothetical protein VKI83_03945 [Synechococcaceae cyanobacterium]|nr:hypothetical protein [Synechococcaceae cyanobacterium]
MTTPSYSSNPGSEPIFGELLLEQLEELTDLQAEAYAGGSFQGLVYNAFWSFGNQLKTFFLSDLIGGIRLPRFLKIVLSV